MLKVFPYIEVHSRSLIGCFYLLIALKKITDNQFEVFE